MERGGFKVITSLDYDLQVQAACAAAAQIARLENRPEPPDAAGGKPCQAALLLPTLPPATDPGAAKLDAAIVILDPQSGQISAMVGDGAQAEHPAGTLLTPFVYLAGFTRGLSPASMLWDIPNPESATAAAQSTYQGPVRLRTALANDYLAPAAQVIQQVGALNVARIAGEMGILKDGLTSLTTGEDFLNKGQTTLLDASQAYGAFANQGILVGRAGDSQPLAFLQLEDLDGQVLAQSAAAASKPVISSQLAYLVTDILSDEPARWQSLGHPNPLEIGRPAAVKQGKTGAGQDAWTVGYTPDRVVGVWVGLADQNTPSPVAPNAAAALWHAVIQQANRANPPQGWSVPQGISNVSVCDPSGMLPTADCPTVVNEIFLSGSEPSQLDNLYRRVQVNRETGRLATVFTPPELVEERVYMQVPPEAEAWARQSGLPLPPESYDVILATQTNPDVNIRTPEMFTYVRGAVSITGSATGAGFNFYRVQVGEGLNPQAWEQVGEDQSQPVEAGELAEWDTQGLDGLYAIQLLVVRDDQRVETAITQVTVDNQAPQVEILSPTAGQAFDQSQKLVTLRVNASDDLALKQVDFYIDGRKVASLAQSPFTYPLGSDTGKTQADGQSRRPGGQHRRSQPGVQYRQIRKTSPQETNSPGRCFY